jgi:prolyl-tRNA synthetase
VVAAEGTETPSGAIGNHLKLKELRLANEDLIKQVLPSAGSKDDVSALPLASPAPAELKVILDATLASSNDEYAVHLAQSSTTILLKGKDIKVYLDSLINEGVEVVDFAALKAAQPAPSPAPSKSAAA